MEIAQETKKLLEQYQSWYRSLEPVDQIGTLSVDEVASKVASFYEKIRGVVDWREEHLLRKTAIERILKRRILIEGKEIAEPFLLELIRGGHLPNNRIPVDKVTEVQKIIDKYYLLIEQNPNLRDWILSIAACEIEECIVPSFRERALITLMTKHMEKKIRIREKDKTRISEEERTLLIFIAVHRALFKVDDATISFHLLERFYPEWQNPTPDYLISIAQSLEGTKIRIDELFKSYLGEKFYQIIETCDTPYLILGDIISKNPNEFLNLAENPTQFESAIHNAYNIRLNKLRAKIKRAAMFSTLSVFLSKVLVALAVEIPIDAKITHQLDFSAVGLSILIPPLLMFFLVMSAKSSSQENLQKILMEVTKITYESEREEVITLALPRRKKGLIALLVNLVYFVTFFFSFGVLFVVLRKSEFSVLSTFVFFLFFSLVAYAGTRIRQRAKELLVEQPKEGFLSGLFDFFFLPFIRVGKWLSSQLPRYNILVILLNIFIEAPFQIFVEFIEQLRIFWKEKKEEIH